eukprot:368367-Amphidinium_carterae.1
MYVAIYMQEGFATSAQPPPSYGQAEATAYSGVCSATSAQQQPSYGQAAEPTSYSGAYGAYGPGYGVHHQGVPLLQTN